jgi:hypothetical protein
MDVGGKSVMECSKKSWMTSKPWKYEDRSGVNLSQVSLDPGGEEEHHIQRWVADDKMKEEGGTVQKVGREKTIH